MGDHTPRVSAREQIILALRRSGPVPRATLGRLTGLSPASISTITGLLISEGVIVEKSEDDALSTSPASPGRPGIRLDFNAELGVVVGLWVGLNRLVLQMADLTGTIILSQEESITLSTLSAPLLAETLAIRVEALLAVARPKAPILGIGISFQGFVDQEAGQVIWSPVIVCRNVPLVEVLQRRLGLPVMLDNDASSMAYAICRRDPALQIGITACIMIGDGVGLGLLRNRQLIRGARGGGNEFGHMRINIGGPQCRCGALGCLESYLADYAIYRDAMAISDLLPPKDGRQPSETDMISLLQRADAGEDALSKLFNRAGEILAVGVANLIHLFQPDNVVFCGSGMRARHYIEPAFLRAVEAQTIQELRQRTQFSVAHYTPELLTEGIVLQVLEKADQAIARTTLDG